MTEEHNSKAQKWYLLIGSILIDTIGVISYLFPVIGEGLDTIWAPISAGLILLMYKNIGLTGYIGAIVGGLEEALPTTDIIPTATLLWVYKYFVKR